VLQIQLLPIIVLSLIYYVFYTFYYQLIFYTLIVFFIFYWISSIFIFLFKSGLYSKTTSVIQRFWKRTLYLFWSLELFLFFIYSWLILIAPSEVEWFFDHSQLYLVAYVQGSSLFNQILTTLLIITVTVLSQYLISFVKIEFFLLILAYLLFKVLCNDGSQVIVSSLFYGNTSVWFNTPDFNWSISTDLLENRVDSNYTWLVIILKF